MADTVKEEIILGAGEVFMYEFSGTTIPTDVEIETEAHNVGSCSGGFSIDYKPEKYDVKNQYGKTVRSFIISEAVTTKTGILKWDLSKLALLSTATYTTTAATASSPEIRKLVVGGSKNGLKTVLMRFVHTKEDGNKIRYTVIGQGGNGFALEFTTKELTIDATLEAIEAVKDFLFSLEEEVGTKTGA